MLLLSGAGLGLRVGVHDDNVIDEYYSFEDPDVACRFYANGCDGVLYDDPVSVTFFIGDETKADNFAYKTRHEFHISEARDPNSKFVAMMRSLAGKQNVYMTEAYVTSFFETDDDTDDESLCKVVFGVYADSKENADAFDVAIRREFGALMRHMSKFDTKAERLMIITTINGVENYINAQNQNEFELALVVLHDKVQKYGIQSVEVMTIRNSDGRVMRRDRWIETPQHRNVPPDRSEITLIVVRHEIPGALLVELPFVAKAENARARNFVLDESEEDQSRTLIRRGDIDRPSLSQTFGFATTIFQGVQNSLFRSLIVRVGAEENSHVAAATPTPFSRQYRLSAATRQFDEIDGSEQQIQ